MPPARRSKGRSSAQPLGILPLDSALTLASDAKLTRYRINPLTRAESAAAFSAMQDHVTGLYAGVEAVHAYEDPAGSVIDCVPLEQQPSLRGTKTALATPPDLTPVLQGRSPGTSDTAPAPAPRAPSRDRHGNHRIAPNGTIPLRRITLDELARFHSLESYFHKHPGPGGTEPSVPDPGDSRNNHRYAYTTQTVDNIGAHDAISVYSPAIDANQIFSLAQHWYAGGSGTGHQTVEVGWQVYPGKYGHANPVLFIYWTADNYGPSGAYNLDKPGFVQTSNAVTIGGALSPVSTQGGAQMEIDIAVYLYEGNWWMYYGGVTPANAIGYYPTSLYNGGQMASNAQQILFGGETVTSAVSWPPMGSGAFAAAGYGQAAYQRDIYYFPTGGGAQWAGLTPMQPSIACYTLDLESAASPWGVYFFFGGTGGGDC